MVNAIVTKCEDYKQSCHRAPRQAIQESGQLMLQFRVNCQKLLIGCGQLDTWSKQKQKEKRHLLFGVFSWKGYSKTRKSLSLQACQQETRQGFLLASLRLEMIRKLAKLRRGEAEEFWMSTVDVKLIWKKNADSQTWGARWILADLSEQVSIRERQVKRTLENSFAALLMMCCTPNHQKLE